MRNQSHCLTLAAALVFSGTGFVQGAELMIVPHARPSAVRMITPKPNLLGLTYEPNAITTLKCSGTRLTAETWYSLVEYVSGSKGGPSTVTALEEWGDGCSYDSGVPLANNQALLTVFSEPHYVFLVYETNGVSNIVINVPQLNPQFSAASPNEFCFRIDVVADSSTNTAYVPKGTQQKPC